MNNEIEPLLKAIGMIALALSATGLPSAKAQTVQLSAFSGAILTNKPLAYWRLNEAGDASTSALVAADSAGGNYNGAYASAAQNGFNGITGPQPPDFPGFESTNAALQATAATDQAWVTAPQPSLNTNTVTFTAWVHPDGDQADWSGILMNRSGDGAGVGLGGGSSHNMLGYTWNNNTTWSFVSGLTVPQDQWSFVAVVIEPGKATLYLGTDGSLTNVVNPIAHTAEVWGGTASIGTDPGFSNGRNFNGAVDEVAVFNHALSFDAINTLYGLAIGQIKIAPPVFTSLSSSATLYAGRTAAFAAAVTGSAPLSYQWKKGNTILSNGGNISGATTNRLAISNVADVDAGSYTLTIANPGGSVTNSFTLSVISPPVSGSYAYSIFTNNAVAYWRLNENYSNTNAPDFMGGLTGHYEAAAAWGADFPGGSIVGPASPNFPGFETTNTAVQTTGDAVNPSWVTVPTPVLNTNTVTFATWIYPTVDAEPDYAGIFMTRNGTQAGLGFTAGGQLGYTWNNNTTWTNQTGLIPPANQWSFVVLVIDPGKAILYLGTGGSLTNSVNAIPHSSETWGGTGQIGSDGTDLTRVFQGTIDELAVFNTALSFDQINNLYGVGLGHIQAVAPVISIPPLSQTLYAGLTSTFKTLAIGSSPLSYQWRLGGTVLTNGGSISGATSDTLSIQNIAGTNVGNYTVVVSNSAGSVTNSASLQVIPLSGGAYEKAVLSARPLAYWRLNENGDPSAGDVIANDYIGGFNGSYGTAAQNGFNSIAGPVPLDGFSIFEGTNTALRTTAATDQSWVVAPQPLLNTNTVTFTAWVNPDGDQADWSGLLINRSTDGAGVGFGGDLGAGGNSHGMLSYTWNNNSTWNYVSGLVIPTNQWSFLAVAIEPAQARLYVYNTNGQQSATNRIVQTSEAWSGTAAIGNDPGFSNGRVFNGAVDEVAVFNYALTEQQIHDLFTGGVSPTGPRLTLAAVAGGQISISWDSPGILQSTSAFAGNQTAWTNEGNASPITITPSGTAKFYRVMGQ